MICKINSATIRGIEAGIVVVETDMSDGMPSFEMVGLLSSEVKEARERVRTALKNSGYLIPPKRITMNLAPADIRKNGTYFDIPMAVSILVGMGILENIKMDRFIFAGELSLNGEAVRVNGILPIVMLAIEEKYEKCFVPYDNLNECKMANEIDVIGVKNIGHLVYMLSTCQYDVASDRETENIQEDYMFDFRDVKGQVVAKRAAEIMVAGMHNMLMIGTPGSGKSMIAKCIPSILPQMSEKERLEVAKIQSVAGILKNTDYIKRPFRNPHHTCTISALTGGGLNPKPGEITLAHKGVLFMDELPEFSGQAIEVLRQPLEDKMIALSRAGGKYCFPADFIFLAASNPCKCGYYPDRNKCNCTENDVRKYMKKISGPILDRIDLCVNVEPVTYDELNCQSEEEDSRAIRQRVEEARRIQQNRYENMDIDFNGQLDGRYINRFCKLKKSEKDMMESAFNTMSLSARAYYKIIKVARTIADLEQKENIEGKHLAEAMGYRNIRE